MLAARNSAVSSAESPAQRRSACRPSHIEAPRGRIISYALSQTVLWRECAWDRTPLGLETAAPCQPRAALAVEGSERRWNLHLSEAPALHREAERDTTGN